MGNRIAGPKAGEFQNHEVLGLLKMIDLKNHFFIRNAWVYSAVVMMLFLLFGIIELYSKTVFKFLDAGVFPAKLWIHFLPILLLYVLKSLEYILILPGLIVISALLYPFCPKSFSGTDRFTCLYIGYTDEDGTVSKPFILPLKNPEEYRTLFQTFSVPELITKPVPDSSWSESSSETDLLLHEEL